jgi:hypothetical protein
MMIVERVLVRLEHVVHLPELMVRSAASIRSINMRLFVTSIISITAIVVSRIQLFSQAPQLTTFLSGRPVRKRRLRKEQKYESF